MKKYKLLVYSLLYSAIIDVAAAQEPADECAPPAAEPGEDGLKAA